MAMLAMSAISVVRGSLTASRHLGSGDSALKAAESGLRYAQSRLGANPQWRGDGNGTIVNTPDLVVSEQDGNVIGILRAPNGEWSQFRIRFNWQDDSSGDQDGLKNPPAAYRVDIPYVSINNAAGGSPADVPRADGPGSSVTTTSPRPYKVPNGTACLLVEGRAGRGLGDLSLANLNPPVSTGAMLSSRVVESYLRVKGQPGSDAAAMAAGDIVAKLSQGEKMTVASESGPPRVRSKAQVRVEDGNDQENYLSDQGEVHSADSDLHANFDPSKVSRYQEAADTEFYKLEWNEVKKAQSSDNTIPAGTYVVWDDGSLHYYDMDYQAYAAHIQANPNDAGSPAVLGSSMSLDDKKMILEVKANTLVKATGSSSEFNFIPRGGAQEDPPGTGLSGPVHEQVNDFQAIVGAAPFYSQPGGQEKATWTIPLAGPMSSNVYIEHGNPSMGTGWNLSLIDNGNGTARLVLNDLNVSNLAVSVDADPPHALDSALSILVAEGNTQLPGLMSKVAAGGESTMKELNLPGVSTNLTPDKIKVQFNPKGGESAVLSAEGSVRLGSRVEGKGASITSGKTIRIVGAGTDLSASIEEGLNLYAKEDVILSSLNHKNGGTFDYKSFKMKGVIYSWGDFRAKIGTDNPSVGKWGDFTLTGALVAYGSKGNTELGDPGTGAGGKIDIKAKKVNLTFDPAYLAAFKRTPDPGPLRQTFHTVY